MTEQHPLTLYNSLTRKKEPFIPQNPKRVTMYNCGPTVYSYAHIGNARAAVVADVLFRVLRHIYGEDSVVYARNITDVDDKIIAAAKEQNVPISEITEKYARIYNEDLAALGCLPPTEQPKATEHISHMIEMISGLIDGGFAYPSDGHVFFDVSTYEAYGKLSGNTMDQLKSAGREGEGEVARKRNAADFVLWKPELDGVGWDAPFGPDKSNMKGRPGWHIECSAMAKATLGEVIDIHCGGVDLKFPHHENEIAQSCCASGHKEFAKFWVHNEFLNMGSEKMSKSIGNVKLIHDLRKDWDGEVIRLALLKAHYRSELVWSEDLLKESKENLNNAYRYKLAALKLSPIYSGTLFGFETVLNADLGTPEAFKDLVFYSGMVSQVVQKINKGEDIPSEDVQVLDQYLNSWNLLGLLQKDPDEWFKGGVDTTKFDALTKEYDTVRAQAMAAKAAGDKAAMGAAFARSDEIRDTLKSDGIIIETGADGSSWRKA